MTPDLEFLGELAFTAEDFELLKIEDRQYGEIPEASKYIREIIAYRANRILAEKLRKCQEVFKGGFKGVMEHNNHHWSDTPACDYDGPVNTHTARLVCVKEKK